jgi:hypothetical protein
MRVPGEILIAVCALVGLAACSSGSSATSSGRAQSSAPTSTTSSTFTGQDSAQFCKLDASYHAQFDAALDTQNGAPGRDVASAYAHAIAALHALEAVASSEIRPALQELATAADRVRPALAAAGYNIARLDAKQRAVLDAPTARLAADRLTRYEQQVCKAKA